LAELVWKGKPGRSRRSGAPLGVDEIYSDAAAGADARPDAWFNRLVLGDQSRVLPSLRGEFAGHVSLVYVDPPFETGGRFEFLATIPGAPDGSPRVAVPAYRDSLGLDRWLGWFFRAAHELHELLADGGSLYVHLDTHVAHYAKVILDEIFGPGAFQREIVWRIGWVSGFKSRANNWIRNHDVILFYVKGSPRRRPAFHKEYVPYPSGYVRRDGMPPRGPGYPIDDVWNGSDLDRLDSIQIMSFSGEKVGFPTQKNENLVARIVRASSSVGDLVLDCFVGSGTTAVVAEKLGRRWIACDVSPVAIHSTRKRLLALEDVCPFLVMGGPKGGATPRRSLAARVLRDGRTARVELESFELPARLTPPEARSAVQHWSQWIDGYCVDWDHHGGPLRVGSRAWRKRANAPLPLSVTHTYARPGRYAVLVRVYDVLGGVTTKRMPVEIDP
jgi:hypothetical protein